MNRVALDSVTIKALLDADRETVEALLLLDEPGRQELRKLVADLAEIESLSAALRRREQGCSPASREARGAKFAEAAAKLRKLRDADLERVQVIGKTGCEEATVLIERVYERELRALTLMSPYAPELLAEEAERLHGRIGSMLLARPLPAEACA